MTAAPHSLQDPAAEPGDALDQATAQMLHHGVSATLLGLFTGIAEQTDENGRERFSAASVATLRRAILCRSYAPLTLELAQLLTALARGAPDDSHAPLTACYVLDIRSRTRFESAVHCGALALPDDAELRDGVLDHRGFLLHLHRLNLLLALLELLVYVDPSCLTVSADADPGALANRLQQSLYAFLAEHMQSAQAQRKCHAVLRWLAAQPKRSGPLLDDARALAFWLQEHSAGDFRRFRTVAELFLYLQQALVLGQRAQAQGRAQALDDAQDWLALDEDFAAWIDAEAPCADALCGTPRLLTGTDWQRCEPLARHGSAALELPLTLLRLTVFGALQGQLLEASKRKRAQDWDAFAEDGYETCQNALNALLESMGVTYRACVQVLLAQGELREALGLLAEIEPDAFTDCGLETMDALHMATLAQLRLQAPSLNRALDQCGAALRSVQRAGFKGDYAEPGRYVEGAEALLRLQRVLHRYLTALRAQPPDYSRDLPIFRARLEQLHGAPT